MRTAEEANQPDVLELPDRPAVVQRRSRLRRFFRKHRLALVVLALFHLVLFFPTLFMGRVLSPNDVFYSYDPWRSSRESIEAQNPIINDPPASYLTLVSLLKSQPAAFHWNPYIAAGVPGYGSIGAAVMSPFALIAALFPLLLFYTVFVALKVNVGFVAAYIWLRHERLGRNAAVVGAIVFTAAGSYAVWWLWQSTNATALYPLVLLTVRRLIDRKRVSAPMVALLGLALILSGFPAVIVYVAYLSMLYGIVLVVRARRLPTSRSFASVAAGLVLAAAISTPFVLPFIGFLRSTGYLESRAHAGSLAVYPASNLRLFLDPFHLGDPVAHRWIRDGAIQPSDNLVETTIYLGVVTLPLLLLGVFNRRAKGRWFWVGVVFLLLLLLFTTTPLSALVGRLPGIRYSSLTRLRVLLPPAAAFLAAAGVGWLLQRMRAFPHRRRTLLVTVLALAVSYDLALFAARFYPYLEPRVAAVPMTETIRFLRTQGGIFRVAPLYDFLWPNSSELFRVEDVRSHFSSEADYRAMMRRIDPGSWGGSGTVLQFDALRMNFDDPLLHFLGARYVIEQPSIDIMRWKIEERTRTLRLSGRSMDLVTAQTVAVRIDDSPSYAVMFPMMPLQKGSGSVSATAVRPESGEVVGTVTVSSRELLRTGKLYLPFQEALEKDELLFVTIEPRGVTVRVTLDEQNELAWATVSSGLVPRIATADGKVFENVAAARRHFAVWSVLPRSVGQLLADPTLDLRRAATLTAVSSAERELERVPMSQRNAKFRVMEYGPSRHRIQTQSAVPFFFVTSEKDSPALRVRVDGQVIDHRRVNGLFVGMRIEPGQHTIELDRVSGRGGWWVAAAATAVLLALWVVGRRVSRVRP